MGLGRGLPCCAIRAVQRTLHPTPSPRHPELPLSPADEAEEATASEPAASDTVSPEAAPQNLQEPSPPCSPGRDAHRKGPVIAEEAAVMDGEEAAAAAAEEAGPHPSATAAAPPPSDQGARADRLAAVQGPGHKNPVKLRSVVKTVSVCVCVCLCACVCVCEKGDGVYRMCVCARERLRACVCVRASV